MARTRTPLVHSLFSWNLGSPKLSMPLWVMVTHEPVQSNPAHSNLRIEKIASICDDVSFLFWLLNNIFFLSLWDDWDSTRKLCQIREAVSADKNCSANELRKSASLLFYRFRTLKVQSLKHKGCNELVLKKKFKCCVSVVMISSRSGRVKEGAGRLQKDHNMHEYINWERTLPFLLSFLHLTPRPLPSRIPFLPFLSTLRWVHCSTAT